MRDLLFELGSEELPAGFVVPALDQLERLFRESCISQGIEHGSVCRFGTPRRLALLVRDVAANTPEISRTVQGPSLTAAFDADGTPKIPALKFAEAHRVPIERLERITTPRGTYLSVTIEEPGQSTISLLPAILTKTGIYPVHQEIWWFTWEIQVLLKNQLKVSANLPIRLNPNPTNLQRPLCRIMLATS